MIPMPSQDLSSGIPGVSARPRGHDPAAVGHDRLETGRRCYPGRGTGRPAVQAQLAAGWHEDDVTRSEDSGYPVQRDGEFPSSRSSTSSRVGRWATPRRPAGTVNCQAQSCALPRDGATNELNVLPCTWCTVASAGRMTGTGPPNGQVA
jgi:hypothetical protein